MKNYTEIYDYVWKIIQNMNNRDFESIFNILKKYNILLTDTDDFEISREICKSYNVSSRNIQDFMYYVMLTILEKENIKNKSYIDINRMVPIDYEIPFNEYSLSSIFFNLKRLYIYYKDNSKDGNRYYCIENHRIVTCDNINYYDNDYDFNLRKYNKKFRIYRESELDPYYKIRYFNVLNNRDYCYEFNFRNNFGIYHYTIADVIFMLCSDDLSKYIFLLGNNSNSKAMGTFIRINNILYFRDYYTNLSACKMC